MRKLTFKFVQNYFKEQKCELLSKEYINSITKLKYKCKCGNESYIRYGDFQQGTRCKICSEDRKKLSYDYIKKYFQKQGCELLSLEEHINFISKSMLKYKCVCANINYIRWGDFQQGHKCSNCAGNKKLIFEDVYNYFIKQNCELLETEYINNSTNMKFICECKNKSIITFNVFKNKNQRCPICCYNNREKNLKLYKNYELPSGKIIKIQGYEHIALDELVNIYTEDDILTSRKDMPEIIYKLQHNLENNKIIFKDHRYYPDFYIKSQNKIIEVKSSFTYKIDLIKNINKVLATKKLGYDFEFWIYTLYKKDYIKNVL